LLRRGQGGERIELHPIAGDFRHVVERLARFPGDEVDTMNRAPVREMPSSRAAPRMPPLRPRPPGARTDAVAQL
jgi:hypothetical protein